MPLFRWDDTFDEFMMGFIALLFYGMMGFWLLGALCLWSWELLIAAGFFAFFGGFFHFTKVVSDGRVRQEQFKKARREGIDRMREAYDFANKSNKEKERGLDENA